MRLVDRFPKDNSAVFVTREECDRWVEDQNLRDAIQGLIEGIDESLLPVTTLGGFVVDVWTPEGWQSGLLADDGDC